MLLYVGLTFGDLADLCVFQILFVSLNKLKESSLNARCSCIDQLIQLAD